MHSRSPQRPGGNQRYANHLWIRHLQGIRSAPRRHYHDPDEESRSNSWRRPLWASLPPATSARPLGSRATPTIARAAVSRFGRLHAGAFLHRENISHSQGRKGRHRAGEVQKGDADQQVAGTPDGNYLVEHGGRGAARAGKGQGSGRAASPVNLEVINEYMDSIYRRLPLHFEGWRQG